MLDQTHPLDPNARLHPERPGDGVPVRFKTATPLPPWAHKTADGYYAGIFSATKIDSTGSVNPEHIAPFDEVGNNVLPIPPAVKSLEQLPVEMRFLYEPKGDLFTPKHPQPQHIKLRPADVLELHHMEDTADIPAARMGVHNPKDPHHDPNYVLPARRRRMEAEAAKASITKVA